MLGKIETLVEAADELEKIAGSITAWLDATRHLPVPPMMFMVEQARIVQLFYHHILTDQEIIRVLHGEGYEHLTLRRLQMLRLSMGISRHSRTGNFLTNTEEIKEILERELNVGGILHYGRRRVYEHLRRQGYLIARFTILILNI